MRHKSVKVISLIVFFLFASSSYLAALKVGDRAPNFSLRDQNNLTHELNDYKGNWVILYLISEDFNGVNEMGYLQIDFGRPYWS